MFDGKCWWQPRWGEEQQTCLTSWARSPHCSPVSRSTRNCCLSPGRTSTSESLISFIILDWFWKIIMKSPWLSCCWSVGRNVRNMNSLQCSYFCEKFWRAWSYCSKSGMLKFNLWWFCLSQRVNDDDIFSLCWLYNSQSLSF